MLELLREFLYTVCTKKFTPVFRKIGTKQNYLADYLSRCHDPTKTAEYFAKENLPMRKLVKLPAEYFDLNSNWWHFSAWDCPLNLSTISVTLSISVLNKLRIDNRITQGFKYTRESAANIVSGFRQWIYFTLYFMLPILPAEVDPLVCFLELMSRSCGYHHLKHVLHSIKFVHQALDTPFPENSFQIDMTMQGAWQKSHFKSCLSPLKSSEIFIYTWI